MSATTTAADILAEAHRQASQITADARARAESMERDWIQRHRESMGALVDSREELDRRVEDLRAFEREYRHRLRVYLTAQLDTLNEHDPRDWPRQEMIGPEWTLIGPGLEVKVVGVEPAGHDGLQRRAIVELRQVQP
jgi:hypothetical protein